MHTGATVIIKGTAVTAGFAVSANPQFCTNVTTPGIAKLIGGIMTGTLLKLTKAGTFAYYCAIHPFMKGTVIVK